MMFESLSAITYTSSMCVRACVCGCGCDRALVLMWKTNVEGLFSSSTIRVRGLNLGFQS